MNVLCAKDYRVVLPDLILTQNQPVQSMQNSALWDDVEARKF